MPFYYWPFMCWGDVWQLHFSLVTLREQPEVRERASEKEMAGKRFRLRFAGRGFLWQHVASSVLFGIRCYQRYSRPTKPPW